MAQPDLSWRKDRPQVGQYITLTLASLHRLDQERVDYHVRKRPARHLRTILPKLKTCRLSLGQGTNGELSLMTIVERLGEH